MSGVHVPQWALVEIGVDAAGVKPATVRKWIERGHVTRYPDGFDPDEMLQWIDAIRNIEQARGAVVATHVRHQTRRAAS